METEKERLQGVMDDFKSHKCVQIHLIWDDGRKGGIGNPKAIEVAMTALIHELELQLNEL